MRVTEIFERLTPRMLWDASENCRFVVNGYFYDAEEAELFGALMKHFIGSSGNFYRRRDKSSRRVNEIIWQLSGSDVETFLRSYLWKDKRKRNRQRMMLREIDSQRVEPDVRPHRCIQESADDAGACQRCRATAR